VIVRIGATGSLTIFEWGVGKSWKYTKLWRPAGRFSLVGNRRPLPRLRIQPGELAILRKKEYDQGRGGVIGQECHRPRGAVLSGMVSLTGTKGRVNNAGGVGISSLSRKEGRVCLNLLH